MCENGFIWNPSTCECDKSCVVGKYLDDVNCKCRKRLIDTPVEKNDEDNDGNEMVYNVTLYDFGLNSRVWKYCMLNVTLFIIVFALIIIGIIGVSFHFY